MRARSWVWTWLAVSRLVSTQRLDWTQDVLQARGPGPREHIHDVIDGIGYWSFIVFIVKPNWTLNCPLPHGKNEWTTL